MKVFFLIPGDIDALTGGYLYNRYMITGLQQRGHVVDILRLDETIFPPAQKASGYAAVFDRLPDGAIVMVDSLVLGYLTEVLKAFSNKLNFIGVIHLPLSFNPLDVRTNKPISRKEMEAMLLTRKIIVTGQFMVHLLASAGIPEKLIVLIEPGVEEYPRKKSYLPLPVQLLCVSNYSPVKNQLLLLKALNKLKDYSWSLLMYGNMQQNRTYADSLHAFISETKLTERIHMHDVIARKNISSAYLRADLFILPSRFETYGMVLAEALAHGIPVVSTLSGNIPDTVPGNMGRFFESDNLESLVAVLEELFCNHALYERLCVSASGYYRMATSWKKSVEKLERELLDFCANLHP